MVSCRDSAIAASMEWSFLCPAYGRSGVSCAIVPFTISYSSIIASHKADQFRCKFVQYNSSNYTFRKTSLYSSCRKYSAANLFEYSAVPLLHTFIKDPDLQPNQTPEKPSAIIAVLVDDEHVLPTPFPELIAMKQRCFSKCTKAQ